MQCLEEKKPRTLWELWRDNRDLATWLTFWAVIILGVLGVLLGLAQVALSAGQLVATVSTVNSILYKFFTCLWQILFC